jgi:hypothetical protein
MKMTLVMLILFLGGSATPQLLKEQTFKDLDVSENAVTKARLLVDQLHAKAALSNIKLQPQQVALAYDIFFGYIHDREYFEQPEGKSSPTVIWVSTERKAGTSTLLDLIAEVINPDTGKNQHIYMKRWLWGNDQPVTKIREQSLGSKVVIIDNFSFYRGAVTEERIHFLPELLQNFKGDTVFLFVDSGQTKKILNQVELPLIDFFATGTHLVQYMCRNIIIRQ